MKDKEKNIFEKEISKAFLLSDSLRKWNSETMSILHTGEKAPAAGPIYSLSVLLWYSCLKYVEN